jgi:hypothetical protein
MKSGPNPELEGVNRLPIRFSGWIDTCVQIFVAFGSALPTMRRER